MSNIRNIDNIGPIKCISKLDTIYAIYIGVFRYLKLSAMQNLKVGSISTTNMYKKLNFLLKF